MPNCPNCKANISTKPEKYFGKNGDDIIRHKTCLKCEKFHYIDAKGNIASETECPGCMVWIARGGPNPQIPCHAIMMHHKIPGYFKEIKKTPNEPECKGCVIRNPLTRGGLSCLAIPNYHTNLPNIDWNKMPSGSSTGTGY
jgi:hypothetical protein